MKCTTVHIGDLIVAKVLSTSGNCSCQTCDNSGQSAAMVTSSFDFWRGHRAPALRDLASIGIGLLPLQKANAGISDGLANLEIV